MAKKYTLDSQAEEEFHILGIATQLKDYRLCHQLNKNLYLEFEKIDDLKAELSSPNSAGNFSCYRYQNPENFIDFFLLANKGPDGILLPDLRQADYFLVALGPFSRESQDRFLKTTKKITGVLAAFPIDIPKLKNIQSFLTELQMHVITCESKGKSMRRK